MMKYISSLALCSILLLVTACGGKRCGSGCCPTTTTRISTDSSTVVVHDGGRTPHEQTIMVTGPSDKEALEEAELEEVMTNK